MIFNLLIDHGGMIVIQEFIDSSYSTVLFVFFIYLSIYVYLKILWPYKDVYKTYDNDRNQLENKKKYIKAFIAVGLCSIIMLIPNLYFVFYAMGHFDNVIPFISIIASTLFHFYFHYVKRSGLFGFVEIFTVFGLQVGPADRKMALPPYIIETNIPLGVIVLISVFTT